MLAHPPLAAALPLFALVGLVFGPLNPVMATVRQERVPLALRGRVFSLFAAITIAGQPLGVALVGLSVDRLGFDATVLIFAAVLQLLGLALLFVPSLQEMDRMAVAP